MIQNAVIEKKEKDRDRERERERLGPRLLDQSVVLEDEALGVKVLLQSSKVLDLPEWFEPSLTIPVLPLDIELQLTTNAAVPSDAVNHVEVIVETEGIQEVAISGARDIILEQVLDVNVIVARVDRVNDGVGDRDGIRVGAERWESGDDLIGTDPRGG